MKGKLGSAKVVVLAFLLLFAGVAGLGAWNYQRNLNAESKEFRPYRGTALEDLEKLAAAYRSEVAALNQRYERARGQRGAVRDRTHFDQQVDEFERVQRRGRRARDLGAEVSIQEATLKDIESELVRRKAEGTGMTVHLRRLLGF